jgi:hypothetical protein
LFHIASKDVLRLPIPPPFIKGAVANARRLQATASFFTPFPSLFLKAILNRSESSGFYRVGIVFGYA